MRNNITITGLKHLAKAECRVTVMVSMTEVCHYHETEILPFYLAIIENVMNMLIADEK
jgi:hypothetical protein